jgi:Protein of unknown function (DUF2934)
MSRDPLASYEDIFIPVIGARGGMCRFASPVLDPGALAEHVRRARDTYRAEVERQAYHLAEQRQFAPGHELDDWITAEAMVASKARRTHE